MGRQVPGLNPFLITFLVHNVFNISDNYISSNGMIITGLLVFWTFPSSGILETRKHDVSKTGSVSVLR
jgi:hypothetical protein